MKIKWVDITKMCMNEREREMREIGLIGGRGSKRGRKNKRE